MTTMFRIPTPLWARPLRRSIHSEFGDAEFEKLFRQHESLLEIVHEAVQDYVNDRTLTFDSEDVGFPSRNRLTGEYYISDESYWVNDEPWFPSVGRNKEYRFSFMVHCLEPALRPNFEDRDYLGLEVHFVWLPEDNKFAFLGDVDSSSI